METRGQNKLEKTTGSGYNNLTCRYKEGIKHSPENTFIFQHDVCYRKWIQMCFTSNLLVLYLRTTLQFLGTLVF